MDGFAGTLTSEVGDEEIDIRGLLLVTLVLIDAEKKIPSAENIEDILVDGNVSAGPATELLRKLLQGKTRRENLAAGTGLQKDGRSRHEPGCQNETQSGTRHHVLDHDD